MYIQITTRCNMTCAHCCFACTSRGQDMNEYTFRAALEIAREAGTHVSIGGGEPTIHPQFWPFLALAIARCESVWLATNGAQTDDAIALAAMAEKGVIGCALSRDDYHDPIDYDVVRAFEHHTTLESLRRDGDQREIRNVTGREIKSGRCKDGRKECPCDGYFVKPAGDIHVCGCKRSPSMGNVRDGWGSILWSMAEDEVGNTVSCYRELKGKKQRQLARMTA